MVDVSLLGKFLGPPRTLYRLLLSFLCNMSHSFGRYLAVLSRCCPTRHHHRIASPFFIFFANIGGCSERAYKSFHHEACLPREPTPAFFFARASLPLSFVRGNTPTPCRRRCSSCATRPGPTRKVKLVFSLGCWLCSLVRSVVWLFVYGDGGVCRRAGVAGGGSGAQTLFFSR